MRDSVNDTREKRHFTTTRWRTPDEIRLTSGSNREGTPRFSLGVLVRRIEGTYSARRTPHRAHTTQPTIVRVIFAPRFALRDRNGNDVVRVKVDIHICTYIYIHTAFISSLFPPPVIFSSFVSAIYRPLIYSGLLIVFYRLLFFENRLVVLYVHMYIKKSSQCVISDYLKSQYARPKYLSMKKCFGTL